MESGFRGGGAVRRRHGLPPPRRRLHLVAPPPPRHAAGEPSAPYSSHARRRLPFQSSGRRPAPRDPFLRCSRPQEPFASSSPIIQQALSFGTKYSSIPAPQNVVCTTTAEALAMGKIVICANHPSNEFFKQFPNCRIYYNNEEEFVQLTLNAPSEQPAPLTDMQMYELSWEAATQRFIEAAEINPNVPESKIHRTLRSSLPAFLRTRRLKQNLKDASVYLHLALSGLVKSPGVHLVLFQKSCSLTSSFANILVWHLRQRGKTLEFKLPM